MLLASKIMNLGITAADDIHAMQLKRQVNGLNLFYFFVALSAFFVFQIFIPGATVLKIIQVFATLMYASYLMLSALGKINVARVLTIYTFEVQLFLVALFTNGFHSPVIYIFVLFPVLAGLVEESLVKHLGIALAAAGLLLGLHYALPRLETAIMNVSRFDSLKIEVLIIMAVLYIPVMATVILQIIIRENRRARIRQKEMLLTETKYEENKKYLDNINEGLLLINRDFTISGQFSKSITKIINAGDIAGANIIDIVYPDANKHRDRRDALEKYLTILFNNTTAHASMLRSANPLEDSVLYFKGSNNDPKSKIVKIGFQRIFNKGRIENIMALFEDVTDVIRKESELEIEKTRKETEMESLSAILKQGPQTFRDFIEATDSVLREASTGLEKLEYNIIVNQLFRDVHSLKAFARVLELHTMADQLHQFENIFSMIRKKEKSATREVQEDIKRCIHDLVHEREKINRLLDRLASFNRFGEQAGKSKPRASLDNFMIALKDMVESMSKELGKEAVFKIAALIDDFPHLNKLRNTLIHLVRNAIDHGIEDRFERLSEKKNRQGTILFALRKENRHYIIEIADDGGGVDFDMIRRKAFEKNKSINSAALTKKEMINLIFSPDFSSRNVVTDISGRGLGLNIVKKEVEQLNGKISILTARGRGTKFTLTIPIQKSAAAAASLSA